MESLLKYLLFLLFQLSWVSGETKGRSDLEKEILQNVFLTSKFKTYVRPHKNETHPDEPVDVAVSLFVINIDVDVKNQFNESSFSSNFNFICEWGNPRNIPSNEMKFVRTSQEEFNNECTLTMYFRQEWNDSRLAYDDQGKINALSIHDAVALWTPDLFFVNEKLGHLHVLTKPNVFVRIFPNGRVLYSQRITVKFACTMDLRKYPFDSQNCILPIESYGYTANDLMLKWKPDTTFSLTDPPGFHVSYSTREQLVQLASGNYSRLELNIHLRRFTYPQLIHVYIPLGLLVVSSWVSFCLRPSDQILRLTVVVITTFTTMMWTQSVKEFLHSLCFTALELWVGFSCLLVFAAVFENIYVIACHGNKPQTFQTDGISNKKDVPELSLDKKDKRKLIDILARDSNVDAIARMAFPSVFVLFNIIYLAYYLI